MNIHKAGFIQNLWLFLIGFLLTIAIASNFILRACSRSPEPESFFVIGQFYDEKTGEISEDWMEVPYEK